MKETPVSTMKAISSQMDAAMPARLRMVAAKHAVAERIPRRKGPVGEKSHRMEQVRVAPIKTLAPARRVTALLPLEDKDSHITGMTRSLHRRLLGLNMPMGVPVTVSRTPKPAAQPLIA
jgi:hypothetical protein